MVDWLEFMMGEFSLSNRLKNKMDGVIWCLSSMYGPSNPRDWESLSTELINTRPLWGCPSYIGRDLNVIRFSQEKRGEVEWHDQ